MYKSLRDFPVAVCTKMYKKLPDEMMSNEFEFRRGLGIWPVVRWSNVRSQTPTRYQVGRTACDNMCWKPADITEDGVLKAEQNRQRRNIGTRGLTNSATKARSEWRTKENITRENPNLRWLSSLLLKKIAMQFPGLELLFEMWILAIR